VTAGAHSELPRKPRRPLVPVIDSDAISPILDAKWLVGF
jgi:hypothetical protein